MTDKEQFSFDNDEHQPQNDLSDAFEESVTQTSESVGLPTSSETSNPKTRPLLLILLLVVVAAGGYYFLGVNNTLPEANKDSGGAQKKVALPLTPTGPKEEAKAAVPAPSAEGQEASAQDTQVLTRSESAQETEVAPATKKEMTGDSQMSATATAEPKAVQPEPQQGLKPSEPSQATSTSSPVAPATYTLDAGAFLFAANIQKIVQKIRSLGYEPEIMVFEEQVPMTRLRLGSYSEDEARNALANAKKIEPSAFTLRQDDKYVVYAGTFYVQQNVNHLQEKFRNQGIAAEQEPIEVVRKVNHVHFGRFATNEEAVKAAANASAAGVPSEVISAD